jgi:hypothetical protein
MSARKVPDPATRLDTIFLTGPGGAVYEVPREVAGRYAISKERLAQIGHLPIVPYGSKPQPDQGREAGEAGEGAEVEARHMTYSPTYGQVWHSNYMYGVYLWNDGNYYQGEHYHPYNTELGAV